MFSQLVNQTLDRYKILSLLGEGGMGAVFKAVDLTLQREVAIKVMHPQLASQQDFQDRFLQEARTAARLDNPSIVQVYDFGRSQRLLYIVMEFIPGDNLADMLKDLKEQNKWILLPEAVSIIKQVSLALDYAHNHGVLHRDIKPGNIMIEPVQSDDLPYRPVLTDLGLAKLSGGGVQTVDGTSMGTPAYMSPEQALGSPTDPRSDVYSMGVLLFELTVGQKPFPINNLIEAIQYHTKEPPPLPTTLRPGFPQELEAVILKTMEKEPSARYQAAGELAAALDEITLSDFEQIDPGEATLFTAQVSLMTQYEQSVAVDRGGSILDDFGPVPQSTRDQIQVMLEGSPVSTVVVNSNTLTIGRDPENDIHLDDQSVSRKHARIEKSGGNYRIIDLGSTNGTYLSSARLLPGVAEDWPSGQALRIGKFWLRLIPEGGSGRTTVGRYADGTVVDGQRMHTSVGQGHIGVFIDNEQLSVEPGKSVDLNLILLNQSNLVDHFQVSVTGIPGRWMTGTIPPVNLMPGDQRNLSISLKPPRTPGSRAGRHPISIRVSSQQAPEEQVEVKTVLTVTAYAEFSSEIHPQRVRSNKPGRVRVNNLGNIPETFQISWRDPADEVKFNPPRKQVRVPEGQSATTEFSASPNKFHLLGKDKMHRYQVQVALVNGEAQTHNGELISTAWIPTWIFIGMILLCVSMLGVSFLLVGGTISHTAQRTQTYQARLTELSNVVIETNQAISATASALETQGIEAINAATATGAWMVLDDDRDGLNNGDEIRLGSLVNVRDTDEDGLSDGEEVQRQTNPLDDDSDNDGLKDGNEVILGTDPLSADSDQDGIPDNVDDAPLATSTIPPTITQPSITPVPSSSATLTPSSTPTSVPTSTQTLIPTLTFTPTKTLPPTSYTTSPPLIDGVITIGEWENAFTASPVSHGVVYYLNDSQYLYILMDLTGDTVDDPPLVNSPWGDYFWLAFDVNENKTIDSGVDFIYATYPGTNTLGISYYLGAGSFSGLNPSSSKLGAGFGKSLKSSTPHRIWEFALLYSEIQSAAGQKAAIGIQNHSQTPLFTDQTPSDMITSMVNFIEIQLDAP